MFDSTTVLVVGAGPTGLLLASELLRRNVACRVIDAHDAPLHWDRATVVHPRSLELFEGLGLVDLLLTAGVKQRGARLHSQGVVLGEIDLSVCGSRYGFNIGISEEVTESILTDYLHRQGGNVIGSSSLIGLADHADGVLATIQREGITEQVLAQWVVGCDGLHSTCRTLTGIDMIGHDIIQPWAVFDATLVGWENSYEANYAYLDADSGDFDGTSRPEMAGVSEAVLPHLRPGGRRFGHYRALRARVWLRWCGEPDAFPLSHEGRQGGFGRVGSCWRETLPMCVRLPKVTG